jgi:hypothetical protein
LGLRPGDLRLKDLDTLFQLGHTEQFQILAYCLNEALAAANADFRRLFHDGLCLSGFPMGRYPTAHEAKVQVRAREARTGSLELSP